MLLRLVLTEVDCPSTTGGLSEVTCPVSTDGSFTWISPGKLRPPDASTAALKVLLTSADSLSRADAGFALNDVTLTLKRHGGPPG